jgi:hypothetical protein
MPKKYDVVWSGLDNGHEGQWHGPIWLPAFKILAKHNGANYHDYQSPIYNDLETNIPSVTWRSTDTGSPSGMRLFFRDAREPWAATGIVRFDDATKKLFITDLGEKLARGIVSPSEVFIMAMEGHRESGEKPFQILAAAFLEPAASQGLTLEQLMGGVMQNFRPGADALASSLANGYGGGFGPTPTRRFKHMLTLLESVGAIAAKDTKYIAWNSDILRRLAETEIKKETKNNTIVNDLMNQFVLDCADSQIALNKRTPLRFTASCVAKRFLILTGLAGSGKTKLAQAFARWLSPSRLAADVFFPGAEIRSSNITYFVRRSDNLSVEFWNDLDEASATKVSLPRAMISEWATYIKNNSIPQTAQAREIREAVKVTSKFSDQLHSFETHLKASAFAMINSELRDIKGICYELVPVGADWTGNENILGYPDGLQTAIYVSKPALDLILRATDYDDIPHFLILDEMNLSHVERYFADILSAIESDEGIELYSGDMTKPETWRKTSAGNPVPPRLKHLPENLFIIGTVNVDETTYMFSPKVLDRANVIEFRMEPNELQSFLGNAVKPDLSKLDGKGASFGKAFVDAAKNAVAIPAEVKSEYDSEMLLFFETLQDHGAEFGYRTAYETARFIHFYKLLGNHAGGDTTWFHGAFDCVILQKMLPKLHGSRAKLGPILKALWFLCVNEPAGRGDNAIETAKNAASSTDKQNEPSIDVPTWAPYPLSAEKIARMWRLLIENGFASFAEA